MFKHHFTAYMIAKTLICFFGYVAALLLNQESSTLLIVTVLSMLCIPLFAYLESQQ